jgi:hypothetical protein
VPVSFGPGVQENKTAEAKNREEAAIPILELLFII